jgi:zinc/manganese transport system permease protein
MLAAWFGCNLKASPLGFYLLFALTITASVQVVGVYLVFASLIVPALAAGRLGRAYAVGVTGYGLGLLASGLFDLPAGAAVVLMLVLVAVLAGGLARASNRTLS